MKPPFFGIRQYPGGLLLCHSPKTDMSDTEVDLTVEVPSSLKQNKWWHKGHYTRTCIIHELFVNTVISLTWLLFLRDTNICYDYTFGQRRHVTIMCCGQPPFTVLKWISKCFFWTYFSLRKVRRLSLLESKNCLVQTLSFRVSLKRTWNPFTEFFQSKPSYLSTLLWSVNPFFLLISYL